MLKRVKKIIEQHKKQSIAFSILFFSLLIFFVGSSFASLQPVKSVIITSEKTNYVNGEGGSWQVEKSGKWTKKGIAQVTFDVDTRLKTNKQYSDVIFVLDVSGSMRGDKLEQVKTNATQLIENLLSNSQNRVALVTFNTTSSILSDFTTDKDSLLGIINSLEAVGSTNYYQALRNVEILLQNYVQEQERETIVLFLTAGYPNEGTPNQITQFHYLKQQYPFITFNAIQYEMGSKLLTPIKEISDNQFIADTDTLHDVLVDTSSVPMVYEEFQIVDYIDNRYFTLTNVDDITVSQGKVKLEEDNDKQKITWMVNNLKSGSDAKLTMDLKLNEEYLEQEGIYPTNEKEQVISKIEDQEEDVTSTNTPILANQYKVVYDGNAPDGATVNNIPDEDNYFVFDTISISTENPTCFGYEFKGWEIVTDGVKRVGTDYFIMPEEDVTLRAKWTKVSLSKSMDGIVSEQGDPIMKGSNWWTSDYDKTDVTSIEIKTTTDIPDTAIYSWDVSVAQDRSVIAYLEDDGTGDGTYKVSIGGLGGVIASANSSGVFSGFANMKSITLTYFDTSNVTNMATMFYNCTALQNLDLTWFDTSNVTTMSRMFESCTALEYLDIGNFDTSKVTNMWAMFYQCKNLKYVDVSSFDTSNVINMSSMFYNCQSLTALDLSHFNTTNVTTMQAMFSGCTSLTELSLSEFDTSKVTSMGSMFQNCSGLTSLDLSHFNTSNVTVMAYMFNGCENLLNLDISNFDTSRVTSMYMMFNRCSSLVHLDLSHFNTLNVTNMSYLFASCRDLIDVDLSSFNTSKVTNMENMFAGCQSLASLDVSNFDTSNVTTMSRMFAECDSLVSLDLGSFVTSKVTKMDHMFRGNDLLQSINFSNGFDTSSVSSMDAMFLGCSSLINLDVSSFRTSNVTTFNQMFHGCKSLTNLDVSSFDSSKVTNMSSMFMGCLNLTELDLKNFDTSNVINMNSMFHNCSNLVSLDMRNAEFNSVTSYNGMLGLVHNNINVIVKDSTAQSWMRARLDEAGKSNATVTIATGTRSLPLSFGRIGFDKSV